MLEQPGNGAHRASDRGIACHLLVALLALAQLAIMVLGPLVDPAPTPGEHRAHISAESQAGCHPYHDDHCVVCRAISADAVDSPAPARGTPSVWRDHAVPERAFASIPGDPLAGPHARGPPRA